MWIGFLEFFFEPERREGFAVDGDDVGGGIEHCRNPSDEALLAKNAMSVKASARGKLRALIRAPKSVRSWPRCKWGPLRLRSDPEG